MDKGLSEGARGHAAGRVLCWLTIRTTRTVDSLCRYLMRYAGAPTPGLSPLSEEWEQNGCQRGVLAKKLFNLSLL